MKFSVHGILCDVVKLKEDDPQAAAAMQNKIATLLMALRPEATASEFTARLRTISPEFAVSMFYGGDQIVGHTFTFSRKGASGPAFQLDIPVYLFGDERK